MANMADIIGVVEAEGYKTITEVKEKFCSLTWDYFLEDLNNYEKEK